MTQFIQTHPYAFTTIVIFGLFVLDSMWTNLLKAIIQKKS